MSHKSQVRGAMAALLRQYREQLIPVALAEFLEGVDISEDARNETHFDSLAQAEFDDLPEHYKKFKSREAYAAALDEFTSKLSKEARKKYIRLNDHECDLATARADAAFRLGIEVGRILGGGVR